MSLDRFSAFLLIRRQLRRPSSRNRALASEAIMEDLAGHLGQPTEPWGIMGLLSQLDLEYAEHNPRARGRSAAQQVEMEGLAPEQVSQLRRWCLIDDDVGSAVLTFDPLEQALFVADFMAQHALQRDDRSFKDSSMAESLAHDLQLMRQAGDPRGDRLDHAMSQLGINEEQTARLTLSALRRVAQDLR